VAAELAGAPYWEVAFDKKGRITADGGLRQELAGSGVRDMFVLCHGWNNSVRGARSMYRDLFTGLADQLPAEQRRGIGLVGVLWPSMLFPADGPADDGSPAPPAPVSDAQLAAVLAPAFPGQEAQVAQLGALLQTRPQDPAQLAVFAALAQSLVTSEQVGGPEDNAERLLVDAPAQEALGAMTGDGATGHAQGDNPFSRGWRQARDLLRTASYYEMKSRAGHVGRDGLGPLLADLQARAGEVRVHLVGHSFGARLVSFSLAGLPPVGPTPVRSLTLLQGAFSHFTFSPDKPGALAGVVNRVDGPLICTFSVHDRAVGTWYPQASLLARQDDQADREFGYTWGAMGHDGFQQDGVQQHPLGPPGTDYGFRAGGLYRLDGDKVITKSLSSFSGAHCDIRRPEVTWVLARAAGLGAVQLGAPAPAGAG